MTPSHEHAESTVSPPALPQQPALQPLKSKPLSASTTAIRLAFWTVGILFAAAQAWVYRFQVPADSISYLDMSDGVLPAGDWHRLINGIWSPLYPFLIGLARRIFPLSAANEIADVHLFNIGFFIFAWACFEFFLSSAIGRDRDRERPGQMASAKPGALDVLPYWASLSVAYSLFL